MLGFSNAMKISDVPFPFPYAQLVNILLFLFSLFIPFYMVVFTGSIFASPLLTFLLFTSVVGFNSVAIELENPFGKDDNDISLLDFHARFIDVLEDTHLAFASKEKLDKAVSAVRHDDKSTLTVEPSTSMSILSAEAECPRQPGKGEEPDATEVAQSCNQKGMI